MLRVKVRELLRSEGEWSAIASARRDDATVGIIDRRVNAILTALEMAGGQYRHARNVFEHFKGQKFAEIQAAAEATA